MEEKDYIGQLYQKAKTDFGYNKDEDYFRDKITNDEQYRRDFHGKLVNDYGYKVTDYDEFVGKLGIAGSVVEEPAGQEPVAKAIDIMPDEEVPQQYRSVYSKLPQSLKQSLTPAMRKRGEMMATPEGRATWAAEMREASKAMPKQARRVMEQEADDIDAYDDGGLFDAKQMEAANATARNKSVYDDMVFTDADNAVIDKIESDNRSRNEAVKMQQRQVRKVDGMAVSLGLPTSYDNVADINTSVRTMFDQTEDGKDINKRIQDEMKVAQFEVMDALKNSEDEEVKEVASFYTDLEAIRTEGDEIERLSAELKEHKAALGKDATKDEVDAYNAEAKALKERFDAYNARAKRYEELEKSGAVERFNELFDTTLKNDTYLYGLYEEYDNKLNAMFGGWMEEKAMPMKRDIAKESWDILSDEINKRITEVNKSFYGGEKGLSPTAALIATSNVFGTSDAVLTSASPATGDLSLARDYLNKSKKLINAYDKGNAVSLTKGFVDPLTDTDFYTFGLAQAAKGFMSKDVMDKLGKDLSGYESLTEDEKLLVDAIEQYYITQQLFQPNGWYKAGQVTAEAIPFIVSMGGSGAVGKGIGEALGKSSKAWVKTLAKAFPEAESRVALSNIAVRITPKQFFTSSLPKAVARMATEGIVYAGTTGLPNTVATAIDYMMPELSVDVDIENRDIVATGMKEREDTWWSALAKGFAMQAIEGSSEAFSTYALEPATKYLGGRIMASLGKNGERYFQNIARTTFGNSGIMGQASRHLSGYLFEYTEEMFGGFLRCISGLSDWDQEFNGKNLAETAFGLAPMEAVFLVMGGGNMAMHHRRMGQARTLLEQHSPESIGLYERLSGMSSYEGQDLLDREVISVMQQVKQMKAAGTFDETAQKALASRMNMDLTMKEQLYMDEAAATMRDETMRYAYETYTSNLNEQSGNLVIADYTDKDGNTKSVFVIGERDGKTIVSDGKDTFVADGKVSVREEYTPDQLDDNIIESVGEQFNAGLPQVTPTVGETYAFVGGDMKIENVDEDGFITATVNGRQVELSRREFREMYGNSEKAMAYAQGVVEAQHGSGEGDARLLATSDNAADHAARGALVRQTRRNLARIVGERRMEEFESMDDAQLARAYAEADGQTKTAMAMWMRFGGRYSDAYRKAMGQRGMNTILDFRQRLGVGRYGSGYVTVASYNGGLVVVNDNDGQQATITELEGNKSIVDARQLSDMQEADADSFASQATVGQRSAIASLEQAYDGLVFGSGEHKIASNEDGRGNTAVVVRENADGTITYATEFNIDQNTGEVHHEGRSEKTVTREAFRDMIESTAAEDMRKKMAQQQQEQKKEDIGELKDGQRVTLLDGSRVRSGEYSQNAGRNFVRFDDGTVKMFNDMDELKQAIADASSPEMRANILIEEYQAKFAEAKTSEAKAAVIQEYLDKIKSDDNVVVLMQSNMLEALKARGVGEEALNNIADALHITQTTGQVFRGVFVPGVGVVINADGIASIDDTRSVYVHERQHGFTNNDLSLRKNNSLLAKVIAAVGRFELDSIVMRMSNSNFYLGKSHRTLADEFISHAMEIAYRSDDVEAALREAGVTNEKLISIIKQLDDEQRTDQRLSQSRLTAPVNGSEQGDNRNDVEDSAGESGEVGGQGPRPAEGGDSQAPRGEVVEEQPEEEKKEEPQPQPKTREQMVAEEVSYVLQGNDKYLDNNLREAHRKKKAADKRQPQATDKEKFEQQKAQIKEQQDKATETLAFWEDVKATVDAAKSENQARLDEAEEALSQLDNALNPIVQVETTHKFDKEPANAEEAAAQFLVGFVPASSRINEDSLMQETGWSREEVKRFRPATTPNGGISVQQAGEALYAEYESEGNEHGWFGDDADAKNVLINAMQETGGYGNLARYINDRRSQAEQNMAYALENALNDGAVQLGYENAQDMHDKRMEEARNLLESLKDGNGMLSEEALQQFKDKVNELGFMGQEEQVNSEIPEDEIPEELRPIEGEAPFSVRFSVAGLVTNEQGEIDYDRVTNLAENNEWQQASRIPRAYRLTSVPANAATIISQAVSVKDRSGSEASRQRGDVQGVRQGDRGDNNQGQPDKGGNGTPLGNLADTIKSDIEAWAKSQGYWYDEARLTDGFTEIEGGTESRVFVNDDKTKARKLTSYPPAYGEYMQLLMENIGIFNATFPDAAYEVIGFGKDKNGNLAAVVEQPYIEGRQAKDRTEVVEAMRAFGFRPFYDEVTFTNGRVFASDVNEKNMVIDTDGKPHVIDAVMSLRSDLYDNSDILYSVVTPQQDADYMDAVNRGDMETAQRMVMEAAKAAMPNTKVVDENGNPLVVYHGTDEEFTVFKKSSETGVTNRYDETPSEYFLFTDNDFAASDYGDTMPLFLNIENMLYANSKSIVSRIIQEELNYINEIAPADFRLENDYEIASFIEEFVDEDGRLFIKSNRDIRQSNECWAAIQNAIARYAEDNGYDGFVFNDFSRGEEHETIAVFSPNQIKSADPVTYDDQGNVIPLSQRFNEGNDDIRYSVVSPESQAIFDKSKEIFGTTSNINEAGYILPDGAMLDFSGRKDLDEGTDDDFLRGRRTEDHRDIKQIEYEKDGNTPSGVNTDMPDFIRRGAIRIDSNAGVINLAVKPTQQQRWPIRRIVEANDGDVQVDFGDGWDSDHYVEYDGAKPSRVLADIDRYFDEGIKPEGNVMFSVANRNQAVFVSNAARAVESIKQEKATPEQWLKMIEKQGGLKAGEDKWIGLSQWLKDSDAKTLTKQEVLDFINENAIRIEEVNYGDLHNVEGLKTLQEEFEQIYDDLRDDFYNEGNYDAKERADAAFEVLRDRHKGGDDFDLAFYIDDDASHTGYTLYISDNNAAAYFLDNAERPINPTRLTYTTEGLDNKQEIALIVPTIEPWNTNDEIHFGDAGEGRAIAWIRFGETTTDELETFHQQMLEKYGHTYMMDLSNEEQNKYDELRKKHKERVLVIDEIQSKRHQEGREKGYDDNEHNKRVNELDKKIGWGMPLTDEEKEEVKALEQRPLKDGEVHIIAEAPRLEVEEGEIFYKTEFAGRTFHVRKASVESKQDAAKALAKEINEEIHEHNNQLSNAIPAAPFEKNWMELAMKRMLRLAAEEGYDKVAWTTGEQQAERYNLSKTFNTVLYDKETQKLTAGNVVNGSFDYNLPNIEETVPQEKLPEYVGKEKAAELLDKGILQGQNLRIGGEGMKGFYDKMLPSFMNKYGKQWGVKVGEVTMPQLEEGYQTMHSVDVTPEMKRSVMEGQPMFSFIGRQGAQRLDFADREMTRLNNRAKAMEMDRKGIDPKTIKLATGWEKGKDKEWRYEIPDYYKADITKLNDGKEVTLSEVVGEDSPVFTAYPKFKNIKVEFKDYTDGTWGDYDQKNNTIHLRRNLDNSRYNEVIAHEIQHAIQAEEGFARGGSPSKAGQMAQDVVTNSYAYQYMRDAKTVAESTGITDEFKIWELVKEMYKQLGSDATSIYPLDARTMGYKLFLHPEKYDIDRYKKAFDTWRDGRMNGEDFWDSYTEDQRFKLYRSLAGEVESRNTSRRLGMTDEERRASLARDTEDVERRNQLVSMNGASLFSVAGRPMTIKEATTQELLKLAAENRDDARLQDDATRAATETLAELMLAMRNAKKISKRRRGKMEGVVDDIAEAQARYDAEVADRVTNLATMLLRYGNLDNLSRGEVARLLAAVKNSMDGNIMEQAEKIVDVLLNHQLKQAAAILDKQLKTKASKVNESGVREQGSLDLEGQRILESAREGISLDYDEWVKRLRDVQDKLTSPIETQRLNAELDYQGLMLAQQYRWKIATSEQQEKSLERELREQQEKIYDFTVEEKDGKKVYRKKLKPEYRGKLDAEHQATKDMVLQTEIEIEDSIRALQMDRADAYNRLSADLARVIARGREAAKAFREEQLQRIEDIHHNANSDLNGVPADEHFQPNRWWRFRGNAFFNFLFMPQQNFDEMLRFFAPDSADGKGYLFNRFMKMQQTARDSEWASLMADNQQLDSKVSEVFGGKIKWQDLYAIERKLPTIEVEFMDDGVLKPHTLTQGNALYIYMVNKMSDGAMKLRAMGITQEKVDEIAEQIDPRFIEIADWIQEQFLPKTRDRFNEVHMRLYGAPMAAIENYFPLKVLHEQAEELGKEDEIQMMSSTPGAIKERTRNINPLDVTRTDAFSLVIEHLNEMEHWAAYAEMTRDLNTLLSYKRFRNRVNNMSSARFGKGKELLANFKKTCEAVTGTLKQKTGKADKAMLNIAKGVTASKINFRLYTAMKQIASMPAFWADANIAELAKGFFGFNPVAQAKAWKWAIEELPGFAKRWQSRFSGNEMLDENKSDWDLWRNSFIENASRIGMSPNAFVDAVTVAMGSRMVYESKLKKYKKQGYDDATAKDKALQDAWLVYNESQQSNDPAFLSIMQAERSWLGSALSLFRNASFGYGRRFYRSLANLKKLGPENRKAMIEYMTKQGVRDGLTEEQAYKAAKKAANRLLAKNLWDAAVFGYVVQFAWNLMPMLPYLIGGDDDDKKKEMAEDVALHSLAGPVEGMPAGNIVSSVYNDMLQGGNWTDYDYHLMPLINDINSIRKKYGTDKVAAINDMMMILMGTFTGVDPRGLTDIGVAIWDACNGDPETSKEVALLIMRIAQIPQSQIDQLYLDEVGLTAGEARRLPADELAKRYAAYKMRKNAPLTSWAYDEDMEDKVLKRYEKKFYRMMDERIEAMSDEVLETAFNESDDPSVRKTIGKKVAAEMGEEDTEGQTPSKSWLPETRQSAIAYQNERTYDDMKEDVALRHAIKEAEASGDTERKASLEEEKRELDNLRHQLNGDSEHDAPILRDYRNGRSAVLRLYNINID